MVNYDHNTMTEGRSYQNFDMYIIWLCSCSTEQYNCLIETANVKNGTSYCYTGPINSIRDFNDPSMIVQKSDCLVLHSSSLENISFKEYEDSKPVNNIRIIINKK